MEQFSVKNIWFVSGGINLIVIQLPVCLEITLIFMIIHKLELRQHNNSLEDLDKGLPDKDQVVIFKFDWLE